MEPLNYDKLEECQQTIKNVKALLLDAVMAEIKRTEVDEWDFDTEISAHYPHSGSILVHNIETLSIDGSTIACGCSIGDPSSEERELITCDLSAFDCETILEALTQLRKELREHRLTVLKDVVREHGNCIKFDGSFTFTGDCEDRSNETVEACENCTLNKLEIVNGKLVVHDTWQGESYDNTENFLPDYELDRIVLFVKQNAGKFIDISLTEEQKTALKLFKSAFKMLKTAGVAILEDHSSGDFLFVNGKDIDFGLEHFDNFGNGISVDSQLEDAEALTIADLEYFGDDDEVFAKRN